MSDDQQQTTSDPDRWASPAGPGWGPPPAPPAGTSIPFGGVPDPGVPVTASVGVDGSGPLEPTRPIPLGGTPPPVSSWSPPPPAPEAYPLPAGLADPSGRPAFGGLGGSGAAPQPQVPAPPAATTPSRSPSTMRAVIVGGLVGALVAALITGGMFLAFGSRTEKVVTEVRPSAQLDRKGLDIQSILAKVRPSVVAIKTGARSANGVFEAAGSGIVLSADGLILTNAHVIDGATTIDVSFADGETKAAKLVGASPVNDVALVQAQGISGLTPAELGKSADLKVGDEVVAIGNSLNLGADPSVTAGIVSALNRSIQAENESLDHLIQTDAAINPGNSGGPLVNTQGQVVGINTAIIQGSQNVGFALAIDNIVSIIDDIKAGKGAISANAAFLGVTTQDLDQVTDQIKARFGVDTSEGAFVTDVVSGSGAEQSGLQPGDVIVGIDGQSVKGADDVGRIVREAKAGDTITIEVLRDGERSSVDATLGRRGG